LLRTCLWYCDARARFLMSWMQDSHQRSLLPPAFCRRDPGALWHVRDGAAGRARWGSWGENLYAKVRIQVAEYYVTALTMI
jgi:hypothetical protein